MIKPWLTLILVSIIWAIIMMEISKYYKEKETKIMVETMNKYKYTY